MIVILKTKKQKCTNLQLIEMIKYSTNHQNICGYPKDIEKVVEMSGIPIEYSRKKKKKVRR